MCVPLPLLLTLDSLPPPPPHLRSQPYLPDPAHPIWPQLLQVTSLPPPEHLVMSVADLSDLLRMPLPPLNAEMLLLKYTCDLVLPLVRTCCACCTSRQPYLGLFIIES